MAQAEDLKPLLLCDHMQSYEYKTMTFDSQKRVAWMKELIEKYEAYNIPPLKNCVVCIGTSSAHPFRVEEASSRRTDRATRMSFFNAKPPLSLLPAAQRALGSAA